MSVSLNNAGVMHARGLIASGHFDDETAWSFDAADSDAMLGSGDWGSYRMWFLGHDTSADPHTKDAYSYPYGKGGKVYRSALIAIRQRASQQDKSGIYAAAGALIEALDKADGPDDEGGGDQEGRSVPWLAPIMREVRFADQEPGVFTGYGSVFGVVDDYNSRMEPGAFRDSLAAHRASGRMPAMLWQHDPDRPIGVWTDMQEDSTGLLVRGKLLMSVPDGAMAYEHLKAGTVTGLSVGFRTLKADFAEDGVRNIRSVDLWEVSPVTFPANDAARTINVRRSQAAEFDSALAVCNALSDVEKLLRDAGTFSRREAAALVSRIKAIAQRESDADGLRTLAARIRAAAR